MTPLVRFATATVAVLTSASYPLAGHIRDELVEAAAALDDDGAGGEDGALEALLNQLQDARNTIIDDVKAELSASVASMTSDLNEKLNAAQTSIQANIKAAGDQQLAAIKAAAPASASASAADLIGGKAKAAT